MKMQELFTKLKMDKKDSYLIDFYRTNFFFENYNLFINSILEKSSSIEIAKIFGGTKPVHYARILPISAFLKYEKAFLQLGYELTKSFRSVIIEKHLIEKYSRDNIVGNIKKIKNNKNQEIEIFLIENGLSDEEISQENLLLRHFAIESKESILNILQTALALNEFKNVGGGNNKEEKSSTLYYEKHFSKNQQIRLELFKKDK